MQTAYISFLNERDDHSYFDVTILTLEQFITFYPHDSNAHFWLGYFRCVIQNNLTEAEKHLRCSLSILPSQPYANLVLSSLLGDSTQLLLRTLEVQPHNFRALSELAQLQINKRDFRGASKSVNTIIHAAPFVETDYFIMNKYVNDVLNGSSHVSSYREQAYNTLKQYNL